MQSNPGSNFPIYFFFILVISLKTVGSAKVEPVIKFIIVICTFVIFPALFILYLITSQEIEANVVCNCGEVGLQPIHEVWV